MTDLNLPPFAPRLQRQGEKIYIYDFLRRRFVRLTPEEWVRQHFTHYLVEHKAYPAALLANEVGLTLQGVSRRCDTVLYSRQEARPQMIVEYKAPHVSLSQTVFNQICAYNSVMRVPYLVVSNGMQHVCLRLEYEQPGYRLLKQIPDYADL